MIIAGSLGDYSAATMAVTAVLTFIGLSGGFVVRRLDRHNDQVQDKIDKVQQSADEARAAASETAALTDAIKARQDSEFDGNHGGLREALDRHIKTEIEHNDQVNKKIDRAVTKFDEHLQDAVKTRQVLETTLNELHSRLIKVEGSTDQTEAPKRAPRKRASRKPPEEAA